MFSMIRGKAQAIRTLAQHFRHFKNWSETFSAYRKGSRLPSLHLRSGLVLNHGPQDDAWSLYREIFIDRCYTQPGFYIPQSGDTVLDLGANIGTFALYLAACAPGIKVHCFEPCQATRQRLKSNIQGNNLQDFIKIYPKGVFNKNVRLNLVEIGMAGSSTIVGRAGGEGEQIECVTFSQAVEMTGVHKIDLLKVDIEGAEMELFETSGIDLSIIDRLVVEYHEDLRPGCLDRLSKSLKPFFLHVRSWATVPNGGLGILQAWK